MYTLYKQTTPIKDATGQIIGWETEPVNVADDFFIQFGLTFDWKNKTVTKNNVTYYLDNLETDTTQSIPSPDEWLATYNNYIKTYYYAVGEDLDKNPSNNPKNIKKRIYYNSQNIKKYEIQYEWDLNDNIVKEYSVAPNKEGSVKYKLTISESDPTTSGSSLVKTYAEGTTIKIDDLKEMLTAEISTYDLLGLRKTGGSAYISDFVITEDIALTAVWQPKEATLTLNYKFANNGDYDVVSKEITQGVGTSFAFNSKDVFTELVGSSWRNSAYDAPTSFEYGGEQVGPDFAKVLWTNTSIDIVCPLKDITVDVVDSTGETQYSASDCVIGDSIDISNIAPDPEEGQTLKSCIVATDGEVELSDNILTLNQNIFENAATYMSGDTIKVKYYYE